MKQPKNYYFKRIILFLNTLVIICSVILTRSFIDVYADDYSYIPIDDIEQYNAYRYWSLYGYSLDYSNTISYSENLSGTYTYNGTASGSLGGIINGSFNASIASTYSSTSSDGSGSDSNITGTINLENMTMTLSTDSAGSYPTGTMACTFSNPNTGVGAYSNMTCTTSGGNVFTIPDIDVTVENNGNVSGFILENLYLHFHEVGTEQGGFNANVSLSESESISGSGDISLIGSTSTTGHKIYNIPSLSADTLNNNYSPDKRISIVSSDKYVIAFLTKTNNNTLPSVYKRNSDDINDLVTINRIGGIYRFGGYYFLAFEFQSSINSFSEVDTSYIKFPIKYTEVIPLYVGFKNNMSDKLYRYIYSSDRTEEILTDGNSQSQIAGNNLNSEISSFTDASDDLHNFEIDMKDNMNNALEDINTNNTFDNLWNSSRKGPLQSMNWVKTQFDRLISYNPIKETLIFSLTLGLALTILGKLRNK